MKEELQQQRWLLLDPVWGPLAPGTEGRVRARGRGVKVLALAPGGSDEVRAWGPRGEVQAWRIGREVLASEPRGSDEGHAQRGLI